MAGKPFEGIGEGSLARGLSAAYGLGQRVHSTVRAVRRTRIDVPVISVGNLLVGGTGKTPLTIALANRYCTDCAVAIVTRGYGGRRRGPELVKPDSSTRDFGDEPVEMAARLPGVKVWVAKDRVAGAEKAVADGANLVLLDDGFGYRSLGRDVDLLVFDERGLGNGCLLPAGPLREPVSAIERADALLLRGESRLDETFGKPVFRFDVKLTGYRFLDNFPADKPARAFAAAGIGWPERFFDALRTAGIELEGTESRPDHAKWTQADVKRTTRAARGLPIIVTGKDAVKLRPLRPQGTWLVAEADAQVEAGFWPWLAEHAKLV